MLSDGGAARVQVRDPCSHTHGPQKKPSDYGGNPGHVMLGLGLRLGVAETNPQITPHWVDVRYTRRLIVTVLRHHPPWRRYALY